MSVLSVCSDEERSRLYVCVCELLSERAAGYRLTGNANSVGDVMAKCECCVCAFPPEAASSEPDVGRRLVL